jgi:hypothetical protein
MSEARAQFERQRAWQKSLAGLSWAEKVRMAEAVRDDVASLRAENKVPDDTKEKAEE